MFFSQIFEKFSKKHKENQGKKFIQKGSPPILGGWLRHWQRMKNLQHFSDAADNNSIHGFNFSRKEVAVVHISGVKYNSRSSPRLANSTISSLSP
jgi:hypothetical protein